MLEGTLGTFDKARAWAHLRTCKRCLEACQDSSVFGAMWAADETAFRPTPEMLDAGKQLASAPAADAGGPRFKTGNRTRILVACAAMVMVIGAFAFWPIDYERGIGRDADQSITAPIRAAVEYASRQGPFILPGGENALSSAVPVYRSGYVPISDSLENSLAFLFRRFQKGECSRNDTYWLIAGNVAVGRADMARELVSDARRKYPDDRGIVTLDAIVAFVNGDLDRSLSSYRSLLGDNPDDPVTCINLAATVVVGERGDRDEARAVLQRVLERYPDTPLAYRAKAVLSDIQ